MTSSQHDLPQQLTANTHTYYGGRYWKINRNRERVIPDRQTDRKWQRKMRESERHNERERVKDFNIQRPPKSDE